MNKYIIGSFLVVFTLLCSYGQNMVINPGFEAFDDDEDNNGQWDDWYPHSIEYAAWGWHNSPITQPGENSCDLIHPQSPIVYGTPRTGVGCAGFAAVANGNNEFFYGTTLDLTAGTLYSVSFWIRKANLTGSEQPWIGAAIGTYPATITWSPFNTTLQPNILVTDIDQTYKQVKFCWTPSSNGAHYITFGALAGYGGLNSVYYFLDDVEVLAIDQGAPLPIANATIPQSTYCTGDVINVDGSPSQNETGYTWEIYEIVGGSEQFVYSSGIQAGQAGTLNVNSILGPWVHPGECYRVRLKVDGLCPDETFVDFCYTDPGVDFVYNGDPVCEGDLVNLQVTGENGWTYTWYEGNSTSGTPFYGGTGSVFQTTSVTPTIGNATYTVEVTTPEGCTSVETYTFTVHTPNNVAPWCDGVYNSGDFTIYVQQGGSAYFWSNIGNDNANEEITYEFEFGNLPPFSTHVQSEPDVNGGVWDFSISTSHSTPTGVYSFTLTANDQNACSEGNSAFTFNIVVICDQCPICVSYEDRGPTPQLPLPSETKAGECINAGFSQSVSTGSENVLFQAGKEINLGSYFSAGAGYQGVIEPTTCVTDCEDCCMDWEGFTVDEIAPQPIISTIDNDPTNDVWQVTDVDHPFCAYGALGYDLSI